MPSLRFKKIQAYSQTSLFVLTALIALQVGNWADAERYAQLAKNSAMAQGTRWPARLEEVEFLCALTRRFSIGAISGHMVLNASTSTIDRCTLIISESYSDARSILDKHLHRSPENISSQKARHLRAHSERCALDLFMHASLTFSQVERTKAIEILNRLNVYSLSDIKDQLLKCEDLREEYGIDKSDQHVRAVRKQYILNGAAVEMLELVNTGVQDYTFDPRMNAFASIIANEYRDDLKTQAAVVRAEVYALLMLSGIEIDSPLTEFETAIAQGKKSTLILDRRICLGLKTSKATILKNPK